MKNLGLTVFSVFLLILSCNKEYSHEPFYFGIEEEFQQGKMNQSVNNSLKFSITEINDSRCPSDITCIWEGKTDVKIVVQSPLSGLIVLSTHDNLIDTVGNFSFKIIEVSPYPISTQTIKLEDYTVILKIEELAN